MKKNLKVRLLGGRDGDISLLHEILGRNGNRDAKLVHAESIDQAEIIFAKRAADVVLLDLRLPDAQGLKAIRRTHKAAPHIALVVLLDRDDEEFAAQSLQEGAQDCLIKSQLDARHLMQTLRYAIVRKAMEGALFDEMQRAQITLNCIGDAVASTDNSGNLTFLNRVAENLTGWPWREAAGRPMSEIFCILNAATREVISNPMEIAVEQNRTVYLPSDTILVRRDGFEIPVEDSAAPIHDRLGKTTGAVIVLRDVTALREMRRQLANSAADLAKRNTLLSQANGELTAFLRSSPIAVYATDPEGIVTMWSPATEHLSGFSAEEAIGKFIPFVQEDAIEEVMERLRRVCAGQLESNVVRTRRRKDGSMVDLRFSMGPLTDEFGAPRGVIALAENVTDELLERDRIGRIQGEFVSTVSHELRTPLTSIGGALALIAGGATGTVNDQVAYLLDIASKNTQRLIRLVNDILDIEKLQSGQIVFDFAPLQIDEVVEKAISANLSYAATFGIDLCRGRGLPDVVVSADPDRLQQALTNLISNAVKFSPSGSKVEIDTVRTAQGVRISVADHGPGIPEEFRGRIFGRFAQADVSDTRPKGGSGLGLSIVREIIQRHGGMVSFDSTVGVGSSFHLDLPELGGENYELQASADLSDGRVLTLAYLARHDHVTGLASQTSLAERLASTIESARKGRQQISLSHLLLMELSEVNETFGTNDGNAILKSVAIRLSELATVDRSLVIARLEGAKFAVLRHGQTAATDAAKFADIMIRSIAQPILVGQEALMIEPSVGTANVTYGDLKNLSPVAAAAEIMERAMIALSISRRAGPGSHTVYDEGLDQRSNNSVMLRRSLRAAIDREQFELHYQPLVDLKSGRIVSAEALIRWQHPELGLLRSDVFISLAEENGLIGPLGEWAMRTAMRQMKIWQSNGLTSPRIALNMSSVQFRMPEFVPAVKKALLLTGADARQFELELTEAVFREQSPEVLSNMGELKRLGFELIIDNFGASHAAFRYLRKFSIKKIKIDQIFVRQMVADPNHAAIIRAMAALSKNLKIEMVAAGIETVEQRDLLLDQGCTTGQGYFFSLPLAAEDFAWLIEHETILPVSIAETNPERTYRAQKTI